MDRPTAAVLHRLRTGSAITPAWIHRLHPDSDPNCEACDVPADAEHLLLTCPEHDDERTALLADFSRLGLPSSSLEELVRPRGPAPAKKKALSALLTFLRDSGLLQLL